MSVEAEWCARRQPGRMKRLQQCNTRDFASGSTKSLRGEQTTNIGPQYDYRSPAGFMEPDFSESHAPFSPIGTSYPGRHPVLVPASHTSSRTTGDHPDYLSSA